VFLSVVRFVLVSQVLMVMFMFPYGIGVALAVRLGATLPLSVRRARSLAYGTFAAGTALFGTMAALLYGFRRFIFAIFTADNAVLDLANEIWPKVCVYYFNLCLYALNIGLATGLGQQWFFGFVTVLFLWGLSLPGMYYFCIVQGGGLSTAWACITQPYIVMNVVLTYRFFCQQDWDEIQRNIRRREGMDDDDDDDNNNDDATAVLLGNGNGGTHENGRTTGIENHLESTVVVDETTGLLLLPNGRNGTKY
jgi:Na+-driven multidrug efflux pump